MQTIIKISSEMNVIKLHTLSTSINEWYHSDLIGNVNFNVYDKERVLEKLGIESQRDDWYSDGRFAEWEPYQIGGNMKIITYIFVSNEEYEDVLHIVPTICKNIENYQISQIELGEYFEINVK